MQPDTGLLCRIEQLLHHPKTLIVERNILSEGICKRLQLLTV